MSDLFYTLLQQAEEVKQNSLAPNSKACYTSSMNVYQRVMVEEIKVEPYPIDLDKIKVFIIYQKICSMSKLALRSHLLYVLNSIGVEDPNQYSFHSLRRGAAYLSSIRGVPDCIIKKH